MKVPGSRHQDRNGEKTNITISAGGTSEEWTYFTSRWTDYKTATKVSGQDVVIQLLECCEESLRKDLTRNNGGSLTGKTEEAVLAAIKQLAVREENVMVSRVNMHQDRDEPVRHFAACLRGQATVCKFITKCPNCSHEVNYGNHVLRDALTHGINDQEIQLELLGEQDQDKSLEDTIRYIEAKESRRRSAIRLMDPPMITSANATSSYRAQQKQKLCTYCGQKESHGTRRKDREQRCPAFNHVCSKCTVKGHFPAVCHGRRSQRQTYRLTPTSRTRL